MAAYQLGPFWKPISTQLQSCSCSLDGTVA